MRLLVIVLCMIAAFVAGRATADSASAKSWVPKATRLSAIYWSSDCQVSVRWVDLPGMDLGSALIGGCDDGSGTITLDPYELSRAFKWRLRCGTFIHEEGHLLGLGHSPDPRNIMYPVMTRLNIPVVCR